MKLLFRKSYIPIASAIVLVTLSSCMTHEIILTKLSNQEEIMNTWKGRKIRILREVLQIYAPRYDSLFLEGPDCQAYPTVEEYRKSGKAKINWTDGDKIIAIAELGQVYTIKSIGYYEFSPTMGPEGLMLVVGENGRDYYLYENDLFSFEDGSIGFNDYYIEVVK
jgi:hypothetical protein